MELSKVKALKMEYSLGELIPCPSEKWLERGTVYSKSAVDGRENICDII